MENLLKSLDKRSLKGDSLMKKHDARGVVK